MDFTLSSEQERIKERAAQVAREVIAPLTGGLLGMIILPGAIFRTLQHFFPELPHDNRFVCTSYHPIPSPSEQVR